MWKEEFPITSEPILITDLSFYSDKGSCHPLPMKLHCPTYGNCHGDPELVKMYRMSDCGILNPNVLLRSATPKSKTQENHTQKGSIVGGGNPAHLSIKCCPIDTRHEIHSWTFNNAVVWTRSE